MLFPRNALAPWPQDCFLAEKGIGKVKWAMEKIY
jgi:hypothetical protein